MNSYLVYEDSPLRRGIKNRNPRIPRISAVHLTPAFANVCGFADGISFSAIAQAELRLADVELHVLCNGIRRSTHVRQAVEDVRHTDRTTLVASPNSKSCWTIGKRCWLIRDAYQIDERHESVARRSRIDFRSEGIKPNAIIINNKASRINIFNSMLLFSFYLQNYTLYTNIV